MREIKIKELMKEEKKVGYKSIPYWVIRNLERFGNCACGVEFPFNLKHLEEYTKKKNLKYRINTHSTGSVIEVWK